MEARLTLCNMTTEFSAMTGLREALQRALPGEELYGFTPLAGLPLGFAPAPRGGANGWR
jgi:hypothetical protein